MNITKDKLKTGIQIALGTLGLYTEEAETLLIHHIKALTINGVVKSLPTVKEKNIELSDMLKNFYEDEEIDFRKEAKFGFNYCFKYVSDKMTK